MKVLQINVTSGHGSTGVIATEIAEKLEAKGHEAYIAYGQGSTAYTKSYKIGNNLENKIHSLLYTRILGKEGYGTFYGTWKFLRWIDHIKPDVIQVHNLHSLNVETVLSLRLPALKLGSLIVPNLFIKLKKNYLQVCLV